MKNKLYQALLLIFLVAGISSCDYLFISSMFKIGKYYFDKWNTRS